VTRGDDESSCTQTDRTADRTTNLLISSNVHYVHLGEEKKSINWRALGTKLVVIARHISRRKSVRNVWFHNILCGRWLERRLAANVLTAEWESPKSVAEVWADGHSVALQATRPQQQQALSYFAFNTLAVSETWAKPTAAGASHDDRRPVEAGYRAVARQTVTSCHAERTIWGNTVLNGLKFLVNKWLNLHHTRMVTVHLVVGIRQAVQHQQLLETLPTVLTCHITDLTHLAICLWHLTDIIDVLQLCCSHL